MIDIKMDGLKQTAKELAKREFVNNPDFPSEIGSEYYIMLVKFIESKHCTKPDIKRMIKLLEKNANHDSQEKTIANTDAGEIVKELRYLLLTELLYRYHILVINLIDLKEIRIFNIRISFFFAYKLFS